MSDELDLATISMVRKATEDLLLLHPLLGIALNYSSRCMVLRNGIH